MTRHLQLTAEVVLRVFWLRVWLSESIAYFGSLDFVFFPFFLPFELDFFFVVFAVAFFVDLGLLLETADERLD